MSSHINLIRSAIKTRISTHHAHKKIKKKNTKLNKNIFTIILRTSPQLVQIWEKCLLIIVIMSKSRSFFKLNQNVYIYRPVKYQ